MIEAGELFAGYVIERQLGAGGMGEVYVGRHPRLPRSDAIKVLGTQVSGDEQFRSRFQREAELAAGLSHPAIVQVYDQGEDDHRLWISMQLIDGNDVAKLAAAGPLPLAEVARIVSTVADALDFAGARGLVHRDVKPANILVSSAGHVMLTDFGIARMGAEASDLTGTGVTVGTLNYASPEQLQGETVDTRSDQYSLAATAYHLLAGSPPFANTNAVKVITGHLGSPVPPLSSRRGGLPAAADQVFARGLAKDPAHRFASSREFAAALQTALLSQYSDVTLQAAQVTSGFASPTAPQAGGTQMGKAYRGFVPPLPDGSPAPRQLVDSDPTDPVESACRAALNTRDALVRRDAVVAELELSRLRDALVLLASARTNAPDGHLLREDRDRIRATRTLTRTFAGVSKAFAVAVEVLDSELHAAAPTKADAVTLPLLEEIAENSGRGVMAQSAVWPRRHLTSLPPRGNWLASAAVIAVAAVVFLAAEGIRGSRGMVDFDARFPWSPAAALLIAAYLVVTANTVIRRIFAGSVVVLAIVVWILCDFYMTISYGVAAIALAVLIPLAWGLGRRRGAVWLWSLAAGVVSVPGSMFVRRASAIFYDYYSWFGWVEWLALTGVLPIIFTGLLGWLIDWLQHRRALPNSSSNLATSGFDSGAPTRLRR